jgi:uncharacterized membrane protein YfcA
MDITTLLVLFAGGLVAGGVTAVAGGSSFLTFPMLIAVGLPPLVANITNWIALMPGNFMALAAYRSELRDMRHEVRAHLVVSFFGGAVGCVLLLWTGEARFARAVPWLMLTALLFFALGEWIKGHLDRFRNPDQRLSPRWILLFEFILMVYGGYFGAGVASCVMRAQSPCASASAGVSHEPPTQATLDSARKNRPRIGPGDAARGTEPHVAKRPLARP